MTSVRWFFLFLAFFIYAPTSYSKPWPASKFEVPSLSESFYSFGASVDQQLKPESFKVLIWNMLKGERKNWQNDFLTMGKDKDILMLQEAYMDKNMKDVLNELLDINYFMGVSFLYKKEDHTATGTILGTKASAEEAFMLRTVDLEPLIQTPKTTTAAILSFYGKSKKLLVLNIHGINFANHKAFVNHVSQGVRQIKGHDGPVIYAGDFNTRTKKRMGHLRAVLASLGLNEVKWVNDKRKSWMGIPLDHAFVRNLDVKKAEVLTSIKSSDHKPLDLHLTYPGP